MKIAIDGWKAHITFSAAHVIPRHPKCGRLHGHTYALHAVIHGDLGADGMIFDFGLVKRALRVLADELDHKMITPATAVRPGGGGMVDVHVGDKVYRIPKSDAAVVDIESSSAEHLANYLADELLLRVDFPATVHEVELGVDEGPGQGAWVRRRVPTAVEQERREPPRRRPR